MTVALNLPDKQDWTVDPLFPDGIVLTEFRPGASGDYEAVGSTNGVFTTDVPFPVTIDLPALTARLRALTEPGHPDA
jgi:hypothetical protein